MTRFKRILLLIVAFVLVTGAVVFALRERIGGWLVVQAIREAQGRAAQGGVGLTEVEPGRATLTGLFSLECEGLRGRLVVPRGMMTSSAEHYAFVARRLRVRIDSVTGGRVVLALSGGSLYRLKPDGETSGEWLSDLHGEIVLPVAWRHPRQAVALLEAEIRQLVATGAMDLAARVRGRARFLVRGRWFEATVFSETHAATTRIMLDRDDVERVSSGYDQRLTEREIDLVSRYPTLAPLLLQITDTARQVAAAQGQADRSFPEDAFRHVYWSYLLTREFGAEFAQVVTDAHETGATYETGEASRQMDLQNNAIGRDYALAGVPASEVAQRMLRDVRVVRRPQ